jgi:nitrogen fixation/metabolism regulation signal transduction histidine kinase
VVGSLYVGAREATFLALLEAFNRQVILIAITCIALAGIVAVPIAREIARPVTTLADANRRLAQGDLTVRVQPAGGGELQVLGQSFNSMVETLHITQQELLHKERLASMGQLAAGIAHELNNPLGTILLLADMLHQEAGGRPAEFRPPAGSAGARSRPARGAGAGLGGRQPPTGL